MSKRSKACEISQKVKEIVWNRDNHKCISYSKVYEYSIENYLRNYYGESWNKEKLIYKKY